MYFTPIYKKTVFFSTFLFLFCLSITSTYTQEDYKKYYQLCSKAKERQEAGEWKVAIDYYEKAFESDFPFPGDVKKLFICYANTHQEEGMIRTWRTLILCGHNLETKLPNSHVTSTYNRLAIEGIKLDSTFENSLLLEYDSLRALYLKGIDSEKDNKLQVVITCASFTNIVLSSLNGKDTSYINRVQRDLTKAEVTNLSSLDFVSRLERPYTETWLDPSFILTLYEIAHRVDKADKEFFFIILKIYMMKGYIQPEIYAFIYDTYSSQQEGKIVYGEKWYGFPKTADAKEVDIKELNKNRKEIFLPPLSNLQ